MEHEDRERLKRVLELSEKNNMMLKQMYSTMKWGRVLKVIYWIVIVGVAVGAFYFLQPFISSLQGTYKTLQEGVESVRGSFLDLQGDIEQVRDQIPQ